MPKCETETEFREWFVDRVEKYGWDVEVEVWSDSGSARVDAIANHPELEPIGFEFKMMDGSTGTAAAQAVKQVTRYRKETYDGEEIDLWCVVPYLSTSVTKRERAFMRSMFNDLGIGYTDGKYFSYEIHYAIGLKINMRDISKSGLISRIKRRSESMSPNWE